MVAELSRVNVWIRGRLAGDATITSAVGPRIYADQAPQGAASPMVTFAYLGGATLLRTLRGGHILTSLYLVRAISTGSSYDAIEPVADRIDALLNLGDVNTIVRDVRITASRMDQPHQRKDSENGIPVVYLGGVYRVSFQPASQ